MSKAIIIEKLDIGSLFEKTVTVERNQFLKKGGSADTHIYFIESGSLRIFITDGGEERIIRFGYQNNIIVALDSFFTQKPSDFYIQAIKKTTVKIISKEKFMTFINSNPENLKIWLEILEDLVLQQIEREKDLLVQSPRERYERVLKRSPRLFQEIPNKHIANYLRMTPETLSRLKKS
ncbi:MULTISPECIES: Crp/Fnr family transcriptional regulator [Flavobacterium]|uniref:Crp/Fnr family transcriptional regulator n=1 Tax=Flavobacterium TaxID=237 RepID=UPI0006F445DC|nr:MULTISPECIES: Crp/Fnr family transcriptional regulator [Flavobacterium]KQS46641.1 Crp/Fnr family transcriptional regulator [Flavobacterium sp. Leaf359]MDQ7960752.1 Crp/Fnr family transcriptional regulator [Flavobacterium lindanitolerans]